MRNISRLFLFALLIASVQRPAVGHGLPATGYRLLATDLQQSMASLRVVVIDPNGAAIVNAQVKLDQQDAVDTNARGEAAFERLKPGKTQVTVTAPGFGDSEEYTVTLSNAHLFVDYADATKVLHRTGRELARFLTRYDVLLSPTMGAPPAELGLLSLSNPNLGEQTAALVQATGYTQLANTAGTPAMSVPLFWNAAGLPIGVQFIGRHGDEATLFRLAAQLEQARPWFGRRPAAA